jgi:hypothetical protein
MFLNEDSLSSGIKSQHINLISSGRDFSRKLDQGGKIGIS